MNLTIKQFALNMLILLLSNILYSQEDVQQKNFQQLQNTLTNQNQSEYDLMGFEGRAIQKLADLAGYLEIISNKEYDLTFRKHALTLAAKLFVDEHVTIRNSDKPLSQLNILELNDYLISVLNTGYTKIVVEIKNLDYVENLTQSKSDSYSGKLLFEQTNSYYKNKSIQEKTIEKKEVDIILVKSEKVFGKNKMSVWNVLLGDIRIVK